MKVLNPPIEWEAGLPVLMKRRWGAIRLAIGDVLGAQRLGFFILDEPTVHLDSENRRRLVEVFTNWSRAVRQVIIITHDEEVFEGG